MNRSEFLELEPLMERVDQHEGKLLLNTMGLELIELGLLNEICKLHLPVEYNRPWPDVFHAIYSVFFDTDLKGEHPTFQADTFWVSFARNVFTVSLNYQVGGEELQREDSLVLSGRAERYQLCRILSQLSLQAPVWKYKNTNFKFDFDGKMLNIEVMDDVEALDVPA